MKKLQIEKKENLVRKSVRITKPIDKRIKLMAKTNKVGDSVIIRSILEDYFDDVADLI